MSTPNTSSQLLDPRESLQHLTDRLHDGEDPVEVVRDAYIRGLKESRAVVTYIQETEAAAELEDVKRELARAFDPRNPAQMGKLVLAVSIVGLFGLLFVQTLSPMVSIIDQILTSLGG